MLFNSLTFVVFFALVMFLHRLPISWTAKKRNLVLASYLFYAAWNPPFVVLLWISTLTDWFVARRMAETQAPVRRRLLLLTSLGINRFLKFYNRFRTHLHQVEVFSGVVLIVLGAMIFTNQFTRLAGYLSFLNRFAL